VDFLNNVHTGSFSNSAGTVVIDNPNAGTTTFAVASGNYTQTSGSTFLDGAVLSVTAGNSVVIGPNSSFFAFGRVIGNLSVAGTLTVGGNGTAGTLTVTGNYTQVSTSVLIINFGGTIPGTQFDQFLVSGTATLDGTLDIVNINGVARIPGTFVFMTYASVNGNFATFLLGTFSLGIETITNYSLQAV